MKAKTVVFEETPQQAAQSISEALEFLRREADVAGLPEVSKLIRQASAKARECSAALLSEAGASASKRE